jgi:hypothetical protein
MVEGKLNNSFITKFPAKTETKRDFSKTTIIVSDNSNVYRDSKIPILANPSLIPGNGRGKKFSKTPSMMENAAKRPILAILL